MLKANTLSLGMSNACGRERIERRCSKAILTASPRLDRRQKHALGGTMGSVSLFTREGTHASRGRAAANCRSHSVHFYGDDALFLNQLSDFVGGALGAGGACIVIAPELHRRGLAARLTAYGLDLEVAARSNRYIALDARETLGRFMVEGWPDEELFRRAIEPELLRAGAGLLKKGTSVVAFGEMVALLWAEGRSEASIQLEQFWNHL